MDKVNERLQEALLASIDKMESGIAFIEGEIPQVIEQLLVWKFWDHVLTGSFLILLAAALSVTFWLLCRAEKKKSRPWDEFLPGFIAMLLGVGALVASMGVCFEGVPHLRKALQLKLAPKVYLIEYTADLVKGAER